VSMTSICRWTGLAPSAACPKTISVPVLDGSQPGPDTSWVNGCLDVSKYAKDQGRPASWQAANAVWADRLVNRQLGGRGSVKATPSPGTSAFENPLYYQYAITPMYGESGWPPICGQKRATPVPEPTTQPSGGGPSPTGPLPTPPCKGKKCSNQPAVTTTAPAPVGGPQMPLAVFVVPMVAGTLPYLRRISRRRRR